MPGSSMARTAGRHTVARRLNVEQALKQGKEAGEATYVPQTIPAGEPSCSADASGLGAHDWAHDAAQLCSAVPLLVSSDAGLLQGLRSCLIAHGDLSVHEGRHMYQHEHSDGCSCSCKIFTSPMPPLLVSRVARGTLASLGRLNIRTC